MALGKGMTVAFLIGFAFDLLQYIELNLTEKPH